MCQNTAVSVVEKSSTLKIASKFDIKEHQETVTFNFS